MAEATCRGCGDPIVRGTGYRYSRCGRCAHQYRKAYNTSGRPLADCVQCGGPLPRRHSKFCSHDCRYEWGLQQKRVVRRAFRCTGPMCHNLCLSGQLQARFCGNRCKLAAKGVKNEGAHRVIVARPHWVMSQPIVGPTLDAWPVHGPAAPRICISCGEHISDAGVGRKRHPECARVHDISRTMELYEAAYSTGRVKLAMHWRFGLVNYLRDRDGDRCALCGERMDFDCSTGPLGESDRGATIDHVVPRSLGGSNDLANLQLAHWSCNRAKGNRGEKQQLRLVG